MIGRTVAHYRILGKLGAGGMGIVYEAEDLRLGRRIALKMLPSAVCENPRLLQRFRREARAASSLNHPHICTIHEVNDHEGEPFIVMELLHGETLSQRIDKRTVFSTEQLTQLAVQLADALEAAHSQQIIHRDIKPGNIFVTQRQQAKLLDFGLAKLTDDSLAAEASTAMPTQGATVFTQSPLTVSGSVMGTVAYMSPDQARGEELDCRTDLFSLGVVLYELATGFQPFQTRTAASTFDAILNRNPPPPSQVHSTVPQEVDRIITKLIEKDRALRYQSSSDLLADLKRLKRDSESGSSAVSASVSRLGLPQGRARTARTALVSVLVLGAIAAAIVGIRFFHQDPARVQAAMAPPRLSPFLEGKPIYKQPAWSPTGNLIAYVSNEAGNDDIWICDAQGNNPINLTRAFTGVDQHPTWSTDGQRIAFYSERDGGGIHVMSALGGPAPLRVPLKQGVLYTFSLRWAPNGRLLYTGFDAAGRKQVYAVSEAGEETTCLTERLGALEGHFGDLSPSGHLLTFLDPIIGGATLHVGDLRSGTTRALFSPAEYPRWSPDGEHIYFISSRDGTKDLWVVAVDSQSGEERAEPRRLTSALAMGQFTFAPSGRQILAVKSTTQGQLWAFPVGGEPVDTLAKGTHIASSSFDDWSPCLAPDSQEVLFSSDRRGVSDIWRTLIGDDSKPERITSGPGMKWKSAVSPDGEWIAFSHLHEKGLFLQTVRRDGRDQQLLQPGVTDRFSGAFHAAWSPDGTHLAATFITAEGGHHMGLARMDAESGVALDIRLLDTLGSMASRPAWSPDGRWLAYETVSDHSWDIWIADANGQSPRRLTEFPGNERGPIWSHDGRWLFFKHEARSIWRLPMNSDGKAEGGAAPWLTIPSTVIDDDGLALNKETAVVSIGTESSGIWLVEFP